MRLPDFLWRPRRPAPTSDSAAASKEVRRLELTSRRFMDNPALGPYPSLFRGHGIEFSEVREYQPGDPFQAIDWKVTARMRRPYVKRFVEERELAVLLVVDVSASNEFGTRKALKRDLVAEVASTLALAAMRAGDPVGMLLFSDRIERYVRPARGRNRNLRLLHELVSVRPEGKGTDLDLALATAARMLTVRSLVFVISDFVGAGDLARPLLGLSGRHDVVALAVDDPAETTIPESGWVEVVDPETGDRAVVDLGDAAVRERLAEHSTAGARALERLCARCHVDLMRLRTDTPYESGLSGFFAARGRRRLR
ncbi:DUF58 domain-containing protein [Candidatus Palauibacter sp.]|uniref:DUF58 domain-containing protein n=1 Tax=Candidatus Palauibacter sp. TaxID=3101350 RepID=UPI003B5187E5